MLFTVSFTISSHSSLQTWCSNFWYSLGAGKPPVISGSKWPKPLVSLCWEILLASRKRSLLSWEAPKSFKVPVNTSWQKPRGHRQLLLDEVLHSIIALILFLMIHQLARLLHDGGTKRAGGSAAAAEERHVSPQQKNEENFKSAQALAWKDVPWKDVPRSGSTSALPKLVQWFIMFFHLFHSFNPFRMAVLAIQKSGQTHGWLTHFRPFYEHLCTGYVSKVRCCALLGLFCLCAGAVTA